MSSLRVGQGFDVHRFEAGRPLRLCGLDIDSEIGLAGRSDADVALHAVIDALLGAAAAADIGEHFPAGDPAFEGADSRQLLEQTVALVAGLGFEPVNCDLTIVGEGPRIAPHRQAMRESVARLLELPPAAVSVKATTTEGLGFVGRGEGLAALAVVLVTTRDE